MKMLKFHKTVTKIMKNCRIQLENKEHHENLKDPCKKHETHEHHSIPCEDHENHEHLTFHARITKLLKIEISYENHENHENLRISYGES